MRLRLAYNRQGDHTREELYRMNRDDIANYSVVEQLRDRTATVRAIRPEDNGLLLEAFKGLEIGSIYMRFFGPRKEPTERELVQATEVDFLRHVALVVCVRENAGEGIIGVGRYFVIEGPNPPSAAEIAFVVEEDYQGQGVASILFKHLLLIGREQGLTRFEADVLPGNRKMLRVFERAGLPVETKTSSDSIHMTIFLNK
jgi:RimJ/RimL family protein N-acetyltransferase